MTRCDIRNQSGWQEGFIYFNSSNVLMHPVLSSLLGVTGFFLSEYCNAKHRTVDKIEAG